MTKFDRVIFYGEHDGKEVTVTFHRVGKEWAAAIEGGGVKSFQRTVGDKWPCATHAAMLVKQAMAGGKPAKSRRRKRPIHLLKVFK